MSADTRDQQDADPGQHRISNPNAVGRHESVFGLLESEDEQRIVDQQGGQEADAKAGPVIARLSDRG